MRQSGVLVRHSHRPFLWVQNPRGGEQIKKIYRELNSYSEGSFVGNEPRYMLLKHATTVEFAVDAQLWNMLVKSNINILVVSSRPVRLSS